MDVGAGVGVGTGVGVSVGVAVAGGTGLGVGAAVGASAFSIAATVASRSGVAVGMGVAVGGKVGVAAARVGCATGVGCTTWTVQAAIVATQTAAAIGVQRRNILTTSRPAVSSRQGFVQIELGDAYKDTPAGRFCSPPAQGWLAGLGWKTGR